MFNTVACTFNVRVVAVVVPNSQSLDNEEKENTVSISINSYFTEPSSILRHYQIEI